MFELEINHSEHSVFKERKIMAHNNTRVEMLEIFGIRALTVVKISRRSSHYLENSHFNGS